MALTGATLAGVSCLSLDRSLSLRRDVMEQMFLRGLVQGRVDSAEGLGVISFRVPSFNSRGRLLFELPHVRTVAHASSPLLRMVRSHNMMLSGGGDIDIFFETDSTFKNKCLMLLNPGTVHRGTECPRDFSFCCSFMLATRSATILHDFCLFVATSQLHCLPCA
ncbi:hypothetical protein J6590_106614 [Homalodisca vitripennis]|nr:hypothetical protein J6590_106614 [Homalodisca vitripennis]